MTGALALIDRWPSGQAAAGVVDGRGAVLSTRGDRGRASRWASVTKLATALAVLVAVEEGTLALDEPAGPPGSTVRHLLAHASGLAFGDGRVLAPPGRRRVYSNIGFEVLAEALATGSGMEFERYLREAVLDPLGMEGTTLTGTAAAGLVGPLDDLLRLATELMVPTLVSKATLDEATAVAFPELAGVLPGFGGHDPLEWGLGFEVRGHKSPHWTATGSSPETFGHFGGSGSFLWVDRQAGVACAALGRHEFGEWAVEAFPALSDAVLDEFGHRRPAGQ
jgi:CubicO group peptidase (beta-lactamase class C family)